MSKKAETKKKGLAPAEKSKAPVDHRQGILALAMKYAHEFAHSRKTAELCLRLYDELQPQHNLDAGDRTFLEYAALLHDIGWVEGEKGHHKASMYMILESPLVTLDKPDKEIVALVARYHRKALPGPTHKPFYGLEKEDQHRVKWLAAILRVADGLDHGHENLVSDVTCLVDKNKIVIRGKTNSSVAPDGEIVLAKGNLLAMVTHKKLAVEWVPKSE